MVFGNAEGRNVDEVINLHLHAQFGNLFRNAYIDILERVIGLPTNVRKRAGLNRLSRGMCFRDEIDNDVCVANNLSHRIHVFGTVEDKSGMSQIEHWFDITVFALVTTVADVRVGTVVAELVAKMFPDESCGTKDCDSQVGVRLTTARTTLIQSSFGNPRHKQIGLVVPRRSCGAIGRCKGPTRTGCDRSSLGETSGSGSSQHHDCVCSYSISDVIILESRWTSSTDDFGFGYQ
mmetsp:Transcript_4856/g.11591  ORF Transcript_4856/g.11591 Transcript_4856/m.11591 type:complete len:234 (+) Transcript_4856:478-1179(+)